MSPARHPQAIISDKNQTGLIFEERNVARTPNRKKETAHLDRLHHEVLNQQENINKQDNFIAENDFDYVFYEKENYKMGAKIQNINRNLAEQE